VKLTFTPSQAGTRSAQMAISANIAGGQLMAGLAGTGVATANVTLTPGSLTFSTQQVSTTSAAQSVSVANVGGSAVAITSVTVTAPFTKSGNTCGTSLAAGTACTVSVTFTPTTAGAASGTLTIKDGLGSQAATLSGTGATAAKDTLSTTSLVFPSTVIGQVSQPLTVTISNTGGLPLTGIGTSVNSTPSGVFAAVSDCDGTLAAASSCDVLVTFAPSVNGTVTGTLTISDALKAQNVSLRGSGLKPPSVGLSRTSFSFGSVEVGVPSTSQTLTITNTGGAPMAQPTFSVSGAGATAFTAGTTTCGATLAAAAACTVALTFIPVAAGATTATLTVASATLGVAPVTAALSGTGLTPPMMTVSPAALNMGTLTVGNSSVPFTVQVKNTGQIAMTGPTFAVSGLSAGATTADFVLSTPTDIAACTGTLNAGATCNIQVIFTPSLPGPETATLTATGSNAIPPTATVLLSGIGSPPTVLQASTAQMSFADTPVGSTSFAQTLTISNVGRQAANGLTVSVTGPYAIVTSMTTCKGTLAGNSSCVVGVTFTPTASGDQPGLLTAAVTNLGVTPATVTLEGTGQAIGGFSLTPTQMTFGSVVVAAASATQTLTVTNSGQAALAGVAMQLTGPYSLTGNTCAGTLAPGSSCMAGVVFTPTTNGQQAGAGTISTTSDGVPPAVFPLIGYGIPAGALTINPAVASFGSVMVGQSGPVQTVTLTNAGATTLAGLTFTVAGDYSLPSNSCGTQLANGGTCSFTVSFSPAQAGTRIGSVTVKSSNSGFTPVVAGLTGMGLPAAQLVVTPTQLSFGSVTVGSNSTPMQLTVTNPGTGTLTGVEFTTLSPFSVGSGTCGALLPAGGTCAVPVIFAPIVGGSQNATVSVMSTSLGVPIVAVPVNGTGVLPASLSISPTTLSFAGTMVGVASAGQTVTVTNPGGVALVGLTLTVSGTAATDFGVNSTSCTGTLAAGGSCSVVMTFKPTVAGGRAASVTVASTTNGVAPASVMLNGTALTQPLLGILPDQLSFGVVLVGTTSATQVMMVSNSGQSAISDLTFGVTPGFGVDAGQTTCTTMLAAGGSCRVGVVFDPTTAGAVTGGLTVSSAVTKVTASAALSGTGALPAGIAVNSAVAQFGTTGVGQAAQPVTVTVSNTGTATALTGLTVSVDATGSASGFGFSANTCGATLAGGASCTVNVTLTPTTAGGLKGTLFVASDNGGTASVQLEGIGLDFRIAVVGSTKGTVVAGQTAYYMLAVTPLGGSSGTFGFTCGQLPAGALCVFNPPQLGTLKVTGNVQLGIATSANKAMVADKRRWGGTKWKETTLLLCGLLAPAGLWRGRRRWKRCLCVVALGLAMMGGMSSCAGAGESMSEVHTGGGTPAGSYPVTINGTAAGLTRSVQVTLVVN